MAMMVLSSRAALTAEMIRSKEVQVTWGLRKP